MHLAYITDQVTVLNEAPLMSLSYRFLSSELFCGDVKGALCSFGEHIQYFGLYDIN